MAEKITGKPHLKDFQDILQECMVALVSLEQNPDAEQWHRLRGKLCVLQVMPEMQPLWRMTGEKVLLCQELLAITQAPVFFYRLRMHLQRMAGFTAHAMLQQTIPEMSKFTPPKMYDTGSLGTEGRAGANRILHR